MEPNHVIDWMRAEIDAMRQRLGSKPDMLRKMDAVELSVKTEVVDELLQGAYSETSLLYARLTAEGLGFYGPHHPPSLETEEWMRGRISFMLANVDEQLLEKADETRTRIHGDMRHELQRDEISETAELFVALTKEGLLDPRELAALAVLDTISN